MGAGDGIPAQPGRIVPTIAMLVAMILWGSTFAAMKYAFFELDPLLVVLGRLVVASICFLPFVPLFLKQPLQKKHLLPLLLLALCEPFLYFIFESTALVYTTSSQAAMITTMLPLMVALAAGFLLGEHVTRKTVVGFLIAAAGAMWLTASGESSHNAPNPVLGNFLEFLAMVCATGYTILVKYLSRDVSPVLLTAVQCFLGTLFFLPVLWLPQVQIPEQIPVTGVLLIVYLGVFASIGAYGLYNYGVSKIPANQASAFINLIPVFAIILGFVVLDERFTLYQFFACAMVFFGVILSQDKRARTHKKALNA
ncbi:MAG: EamA family transporter [Desulfobulbus propionicus]|nr:MAG: EamA family transporter [Desulfobulbus propionicus]